MTLFTHVLKGMKENNEINNGQFGDWDDANHAIDTYAAGEDFDVEPGEMDATIVALNTIIETNGDGLDDAVRMYNEKVWGQQFGDGQVPVAFSG